MTERYSGPNHDGHSRDCPYPTSRLAPSVNLVQVAEQIEKASESIAHQTTAQLRLIAEQIRHLQDQARGLLDKARIDVALHQAKCSFQKKAGTTYHLYARADGESFLSMLSPSDHGGCPPHEYLGSYRLEPDQTWTDERHTSRSPEPLDMKLLTGDTPAR